MREPTDPDRFAAAIEAIDEANAADPNTLSVGSVTGPKELVHSRMMTAWLDELDPDADELQHLAARAHHLRRWESPRSDHPDGRAGYLRWRTEARARHAEEVSSILLEHSYSPAEVERVAAIVRKEGLGKGSRGGTRPVDPAVQVHEDALCLVFLQTQLVGVADQLGEPATVDVLVRTMAKMSPAGLAAAGSLDLDERGRALLDEAVTAASPAPS